MVSALDVIDLSVKTKNNSLNHNFYQSLGFIPSIPEPKIKLVYLEDILANLKKKKIKLTKSELDILTHYYESTNLNLVFNRIDPVYKSMRTIEKETDIHLTQVKRAIDGLVEKNLLTKFGNLKSTAKNFGNGCHIFVPTEIFLKNKQLVLSGIANLIARDICDSNTKCVHIDIPFNKYNGKWTYELKYKRSKHKVLNKYEPTSLYPLVLEKYKELCVYGYIKYLRAFSFYYPRNFTAEEYNKLIWTFYALAFHKNGFNKFGNKRKWHRRDFIKFIYQVRDYKNFIDENKYLKIYKPFTFLIIVFEHGNQAIRHIQRKHEERQAAYKAKEEFQFNFSRQEFESEKKRLMGEATAQAHFAERKEERKIANSTDLLAQLFKPKEDAVKSIASFKTFGDIAQSFVKRFDVSRFEVNESNVEEIDTVRDQNGNEFRAVIVKPNYGREKELDKRTKERQNYNFTEKFESHKKRSEMLKSIVRKEVKYPKTREYYIDQVKEQFADNPKVLEKMIEKYKSMHDSDFGSNI